MLRFRIFQIVRICTLRAVDPYSYDESSSMITGEIRLLLSNLYILYQIHKFVAGLVTTLCVVKCVIKWFSYSLLVQGQPSYARFFLLRGPRSVGRKRREFHMTNCVEFHRFNHFTFKLKNLLYKLRKIKRGKIERRLQVIIVFIYY